MTPRFPLAAALLLAASLTPVAAQQAPPKQGFTLTTPAFPDGGEIPPRFTQAVPNAVSPKLEWTNAPAGVVSYVLLLHDPDPAIGRHVEDALHWMVFNIPGTATGMPEN